MHTMRTGQAPDRSPPRQPQVQPVTQTGLNEADFQRDVIQNWLHRAGMLQVDSPAKVARTG